MWCFFEAKGWPILCDVCQSRGMMYTGCFSKQRHSVYFMFPKQKDVMYLMFFNAVLDIFQSQGMVNAWFLSKGWVGGGGGRADNMLIQKLIVMVLSPLLPLTLLAPKTLDGGQQQDQPLQRPVTPGQRRGPESVKETVASRWKMPLCLGVFSCCCCFRCCCFFPVSNQVMCPLFPCDLGKLVRDRMEHIWAFPGT